MKTGGSAFPVLEKDVDYNGAPFLYCDSEGMTLRGYFAGQALAGISTQLSDDIKSETYAKWAYELANAMLAEREKENA